jgi:hypothetical protein
VRVRGIPGAKVHGPGSVQFIAADEGPGETDAAKALQSLLNAKGCGLDPRNPGRQADALVSKRGRLFLMGAALPVVHILRANG